MANTANRNKTHCVNGHEFTEENTYCAADGSRVCRACQRDGSARSRARKRGEHDAPEWRRRRRRRTLRIMGVPASFWAKTRFEDRGYRTPCIIFTGTIAENGYGVVTLAGGQHKAHRIAYEAANGPVSICKETGKPFPLDHLCRVRSCVNPDHLEPVTDGVNVLRGISPHAANARKTHCINGHEFTPENTRIDTAGHRQCRTCRRAYEGKRNAARRTRARVLATQEAGR